MDIDIVDNNKAGMHYRLDKLGSRSSHIAPDYLQATGPDTPALLAPPVHIPDHNSSVQAEDRPEVVLQGPADLFVLIVVYMVVPTVLIERPVLLVRAYIVGPAAPVGLADRRMEQREDNRRDSRRHAHGIPAPRTARSLWREAVLPGVVAYPRRFY